MTPKLASLLEYQLSLRPPPAPAGSFDPDSAKRGKVLFRTRARCSTYHQGSTYRTTALRGLLQHAPYFHDGSARDLAAVVDHYDKQFGLKLTARQKADLVEYLKSL